MLGSLVSVSSLKEEKASEKIANLQTCEVFYYICIVKPFEIYPTTCISFNVQLLLLNYNIRHKYVWPIVIIIIFASRNAFFLSNLTLTWGYVDKSELNDRSQLRLVAQCCRSEGAWAVIDTSHKFTHAWEVARCSYATMVCISSCPVQQVGVKHIHLRYIIAAWGLTALLKSQFDNAQRKPTNWQTNSLYLTFSCSETDTKFFSILTYYGELQDICQYIIRFIKFKVLQLV